MIGLITDPNPSGKGKYHVLSSDDDDDYLFLRKLARVLSGKSTSFRVVSGKDRQRISRQISTRGAGLVIIEN